MTTINEPTTNQQVERKLTLSDYMTRQTGVTPAQLVPFFISLVDENGVLQKLYLEDTEIYAVKLSINPATLSVNFAKLVSRAQSMTAWVEEHWGEELDTITLQGSTAAFVVGGKNLRGVRNADGNKWNADLGQNIDASADLSQTDLMVTIPPGERGLTPAEGPLTASGNVTNFRRDSISYLELKKVLRVMHTNGMKFYELIQNGIDIATSWVNAPGMPMSRSYVNLYHDYGSYLGYFESFDVTEDSQAPFRFTYNITFKSERTIFNYLNLQ